jgi:hypothetical protein
MQEKDRTFPLGRQRTKEWVSVARECQRSTKEGVLLCTANINCEDIRDVVWVHFHVDCNHRREFNTQVAADFWPSTTSDPCNGRRTEREEAIRTSMIGCLWPLPGWKLQYNVARPKVYRLEDFRPGTPGVLLSALRGKGAQEEQNL